MTRNPLYRGLLAAGLATLSVPISAATLVASYDFQDTLAANEAGLPALQSIDPLGLNGFGTATVNGQSRKVWSWNGEDGSDPSKHGGLSLDATGLVNYGSYSVALTFSFVEAGPLGGTWRRIMDTQNRRSDSGFYVSPGNRIEAVEIPAESGAATTNSFTPGFHDVVISVSDDGGNREIKGWLDGKLEFTAAYGGFRLDNPNNPDNVLFFFVDNLVDQAQLEFSAGSIASLRLYDGVFAPAPIPEPGQWALLLAGAAVLGARYRVRAARSAG